MFQMIKDAIVSAKTRVSILAGAGISMDFPSNLPSGSEIVEELLRVFLPNSVSQDLIDRALGPLDNRKHRPGERLRFEQLIYHWRLHDTKLEALQFLDKCSTPNKNHFLLAYLIRHGHAVLTTNFDRLIEVAYLRLYPESRLQVMVYDDEFDYKQLENKFEPTLWKIHGSFSVDEKDTSDSLQTTFTSMLSHSLTEKKQEFLEFALKSFDMIVAGYSGLDDLDIIPYFSKTVSERKLIWIKHKQQNLNVMVKTPKQVFDPSRLNPLDLTGFYRVFFSAGAERNYTRNKGQSWVLEGNTNTILANFFPNAYLKLNELSFSDSEEKNSFDLSSYSLRLSEFQKISLTQKIFDRDLLCRPNEHQLFQRVEGLRHNIAPENLNDNDLVHYLLGLFNRAAELESENAAKIQIYADIYPQVIQCKDEFLSINEQSHKLRLLACLKWRLQGQQEGWQAFRKAVEFSWKSGLIENELLDIHVWKKYADSDGIRLPNVVISRMKHLLEDTGFWPLFYNHRFDQLRYHIDVEIMAARSLRMNYYVEEHTLSELSYMLRYSIDMGHTIGEARISRLLAEALLLTGRFSDALYQACRAREICNEVQDYRLLGKAQAIIHECKKEVGNQLEEEYSETLSYSMWAQHKLWQA